MTRDRGVWLCGACAEHQETHVSEAIARTCSSCGTTFHISSGEAAAGTGPELCAGCWHKREPRNRPVWDGEKMIPLDQLDLVLISRDRLQALEEAAAQLRTLTEVSP